MNTWEIVRAKHFKSKGILLLTDVVESKQQKKKVGRIDEQHDAADKLRLPHLKWAQKLKCHLIFKSVYLNGI